MIEIRKILVPTDFSSNADLAGEFAMELASKFNAHVTFLHVYDMPTYVLPDGALLASADVVSNLMADIEKRLDDLKSRYVGHEGQVDTETRQGVPLAEIVRFAKDERTDLIVMGTHGRTGIEAFLIGSVAEKVVRKAPCPVLTVRPPSFGFKHPSE